MKWRKCFAAAVIAYEKLYPEDASEGELFYFNCDTPGWANSDSMIVTAIFDGFTFLTDVRCGEEARDDAGGNS